MIQEALSTARHDIAMLMFVVALTGMIVGILGVYLLNRRP